MMRLRKACLLTLSLVVLQLSCRARSSEEIPEETDNIEKLGKSLSGEAEESDPAKAKKISAEELKLRKELSDVLARLQKVNDKLAKGEDYSTEEIKDFEQQVFDLQVLQKSIEEKLQKLSKKDAPMDPASGPKAPETPAVTPPAGTPAESTAMPSCGPTYYGIIFECMGKQCARTDANGTKNCLVELTSKPGDPSAYPLCGANYYGGVFNCMSKACAKSDPAYADNSICEIGPGSKYARGN